MTSENTPDRKQELIEKFANKLKEREEQRPKRERLRRKGRVRNKYRLLRRWTATLEDCDAPGKAGIVDGYRPSGLAAPVDVSEIGGLIVVDTDDLAHHFRLHRDGTLSFIECPATPDAPITIDPMTNPCRDTVYATDGPPRAVTERLEALNVTPRWSDACDDGEHEFETVNGDSPYRFVQCGRCETSRNTLSWLGHTVPEGDL